MLKIQLAAYLLLITYCHGYALYLYNGVSDCSNTPYKSISMTEGACYSLGSEAQSSAKYASSGSLELVLTDETDCDGIGLTRTTGGCFNLETTKHFDGAYIAYG
jgi:hypothetical protein